MYEDESIKLHGGGLVWPLNCVGNEHQIWVGRAITNFGEI